MTTRQKRNIYFITLIIISLFRYSSIADDMGILKIIVKKGGCIIKNFDLPNRETIENKNSDINVICKVGEKFLVKNTPVLCESIDPPMNISDTQFTLSKNCRYLVINNWTQPFTPYYNRLQKSKNSDKNGKSFIDNKFYNFPINNSTGEDSLWIILNNLDDYIIDNINQSKNSNELIYEVGREEFRRLYNAYLTNIEKFINNNYNISDSKDKYYIAVFYFKAGNDTQALNYLNTIHNSDKLVESLVLKLRILRSQNQKEHCKTLYNNNFSKIFENYNNQIFYDCYYDSELIKKEFKLLIEEWIK